jgi:subtilase family serine protease
VTSTYSVTVTNIGAGAAGQFTVKLFVNNTEREDWVVSGLERGQSVALTTELTWSAAGTYDIRVNADTASQVEELSDVNNRGDMTVTVSGS